MRTEKQLENLKKGKATQFTSGEVAAINGAKGGKAKAMKYSITQALKEHTDPQKIASVLLAQAEKGNLKAIEMVIDMLGEKPPTRQDLSIARAAEVAEIDKTIIEIQEYFTA